MKKLNFLRFSISIAAAAFLSAVIVYFVTASREQFLNHSFYTLKTIARDKSEIIEAKINHAEESIKLLSDFVSSQMNEKELKNPNEIFSGYTGQLPFNSVEYIRWDGLNMMNSTKGQKPFDASQRPYYIEGIKGNSGIWANFKSKASQEILLNFYTPLYYDNEVSGVITGAIDETTSIKPLLYSSFFGHQIQSFICDENYVVISSACENIAPGLDLKEWKSVDILNDFIRHSENKEITPFQYNIRGKKGLCCTAPIESKSWHLAVIIYPSVLERAQKEVSGNLFTVSILIMTIMLLYLISALSVQAKSNRIVNTRLLNSAIKDGLTGLFNRRAYEEDLRNLDTGKLDENFNYIAFDVNGLKNVNDNLGHEAGDELIRAAANCISNCFGSFGKVYRTGGDEFIAVINATEEEIETIKENFSAQTKAWKGKYTSNLVIPAGFISRKEMPDASIMEMTKIADQRMYREKTLFYIASGVDRRAKNAAYEVLCESYTKILKINLTTDDFNIIQMDPNERIQSKGYDEKISKWLHDFGTSGQVHNEDVQDYLSKTSIDFMRDYFRSGKNELNIQYRRLIGDEFRKVLMEIKTSKEYEEDNQTCFLYVKNIDK